MGQPTNTSVLVVGKNSRLWGALQNHLSDREDVTFHAVSSAQIYDLDPDLLAQDFDYAVVLSYSRDLAENMQLLRNLRLLTSRLVYISTCSVKAADMGYLYTYPRAKRAVEVFTKDSDLFDHLRIIRLGMVEGTYDPATFKGRYQYTSLAQISHAFLPEQNPEVGVSFEPLYVSQDGPDATGLEGVCFAIYRWLLPRHKVMGALLRPIDFVCRTLGWNWYGYNCVVNYGPGRL